jgi:hypothetical protein
METSIAGIQATVVHPLAYDHADQLGQLRSEFLVRSRIVVAKIRM